MDLLKPNFTAAAPVKVMINIGACLDIPTGTYVDGIRGEAILNGGLGFQTAVVGIGNNFKSTVLDFMTLTAMIRIDHSTCTTYDTEINIHEWHKKQFAFNIQAYHELEQEDLIENGRWVITDKTVYHGDEFFDKAKEFMESKRKNIAKLTVKTPFLNREKTGPLTILHPTFGQVDSFSEFSTQDVVKMQDENSLGESGGNTISMRQGLQKNRFLMESPGLTGGSYHYLLFTAHIGSEFSMDPRNPPPKKLAYMTPGAKIKGAPEKFTFVMNSCWHAYNATKLQNDSDKTPLYPRDSDDKLKGDTDLSIVTLRLLRNKSGPTGMAVELVVSQSDGVLPGLTEFHYLKTHGRFGLEGNEQNYVVSLCPDIKLSRSVVRGKIDRHPELRRALTICTEMCQIQELWHHIKPELICTPKQLYDDLIKLGYDWNVLLATRGWWTLEDTELSKIPYLSTMDLMRMRIGSYIPFWMDNPPEAAVALKKKYDESQNKV
jgi:hypothetical protein